VLSEDKSGAERITPINTMVKMW